MKGKEIGSILTIIGVIILLSDSFCSICSWRFDEIEFTEILIAIIGAILLNAGIFILSEDLDLRTIRFL
jgi:hypothetical protein